jgi:DNA-binding GntR family transcriptional regulator
MLARVKETRVNNAYEKLKADILSGELAPGFQAPEPEIAARLEMSRTPVREALIRLEAEGVGFVDPAAGGEGVVHPASGPDRGDGNPRSS